jgi:hypothetical protein
MNPIAKAVVEIKYRIPYDVLRIAFATNEWRSNAILTLDEEIKNRVIKKRVIPDCNIYGGQTLIVPLDGINPTYKDPRTLVYEVPAEKLMNKQIMSVLNVGFFPYSNMSSFTVGGYSQFGSSTSLSSATNRLLDAHSNIPFLSSADVELVGNNTILIRDQIKQSGIYTLRCIVANNENMEELNVRYIPSFCKLCELAVKSYIYNRMIVNLDRGYIEAGVELTSVKSIIEEFKESEEMYQTRLSENWRAESIMADKKRHLSLIKMQISPGL